MYRAEIVVIDEQNTQTVLPRVFIRESKDEAEDAACEYMNDIDIESKYGEECIFAVQIAPHHCH
jgi:hypothetical protein